MSDFMDRSVAVSKQITSQTSRTLTSRARVPDVQMVLKEAEGKVDMDSPEYDEMHNQPGHEKRMEALAYHEAGEPGKYRVLATKAMNNQKDLSLAYSPGVAEPCLEIEKDPEHAYKYTNKGNLVAVVSNGTAVLGLGDIGALASKPVMEGKAVLFNKFAGVNSIDLCLDASDPDDFINTVKYISPSFGGINLEDIKGPDCFRIERELKEQMNIPVFHDDQHGTAIVCLAGLINACEIQGKKFEELQIVVNGAGAAGIACLKLLQEYGARPENCFLVDTQGVVYKGREGRGMNPYKAELANDTPRRTLEDACDGADVLIGVSRQGVFTADILKRLNEKPVIFAMANPVPEVLPEVAKEVRPDCLIATGRSDYPNQINNVMCFPFLFRAALDTRSAQIDEPMKMAAARALAELTRQPVPDEIYDLYPDAPGTLKFGPNYIVPKPFDPRLIEELPVAVAKAAMESGSAAKKIEDFDAYRVELRSRISPLEASPKTA